MFEKRLIEMWYLIRVYGVMVNLDMGNEGMRDRGSFWMGIVVNGED